MTSARLSSPSASIRGLLPAVALSALVGLAYLRWTPLAPDLAAQVARADVVHSGGVASWWTGWFGGLSLPSYSLLVPSSMAILGVRLTGLLAVVAGTVGTTLLARGALRPRAGAVAFAIAGFADLLDGRVTFAAGLAFVAWALVAVRARRSLPTVALAIGAYFASPLAGLFLGMILLAVVLVDRTRWRASMLGAATLLVIGIGMAVLFPGTGTMPFRWPDSVPAGLGCLAVVVFCRQRLVRTAAAVVVLAFPLFLIWPGAVGSNVTRLSWVAAVPIVVACAPLSRRALIVVAVALAVWPVGDLLGQLHSSTSASAKAAYYAPLQAQLSLEQHEAGPGAIGQRVEVVDTADHWGSAYLSTLSLARGWDRQADNAYNPIFYTDDALTATTYRAWLDSLAVGWVALPAAPLDYASVDEGRLIRSGLSYLDLTWSTAQWRLYRVVDSEPLLRGARADSVDSDGVVLTTDGRADIAARIRWSPYLEVTDPVSGGPVAGCVLDANGWVTMTIPRAETVTLSSHFTASAVLRTGGNGCAGANR